jgi:ribosomal protein L7/L12
MTDPKKSDFLDEVVAERTATNPDFPKMVEEQARARELEHIVPIYGCPVMFEDYPVPARPPMADNTLQEDRLYDLTLESCSNDAKAVGVLRNCGMSMTDAFKVVRGSLPHVMLIGVPRWEAEELRDSFEQAGAVATIKRIF